MLLAMQLAMQLARQLAAKWQVAWLAAAAPREWEVAERLSDRHSLVTAIHTAPCAYAVLRMPLAAHPSTILRHGVA